MKIPLRCFLHPRLMIDGNWNTDLNLHWLNLRRKHSLIIIMHSKFNNYTRGVGWRDGCSNECTNMVERYGKNSVDLQMATKKTFRGDKRQSWPDVAYWPSTQLVEKKQMLRVSRGLSCVNSGERVWGSDSPVRDELSTFTGIGEKGGENGVTQRDWQRVSRWKWEQQHITVFWFKWFFKRFATGEKINTIDYHSLISLNKIQWDKVKLKGWHFEDYSINKYKKKKQILSMKRILLNQLFVKRC